jgi:hypothetical protein
VNWLSHVIRLLCIADNDDPHFSTNLALKMAIQRMIIGWPTTCHQRSTA